MDAESESARQLTAADVNQLAQALDDGTMTSADVSGSVARDNVGADPVARPGSGDVSGIPSAAAQTAGDNPLEAEEREQILDTFPPDTVPEVQIGGSEEDRAALREEYRHS